jgi:hypothetical protein
VVEVFNGINKNWCSINDDETTVFDKRIHIKKGRES